MEQVVRSYKAAIIDEFKVQFDINFLHNSSCSIDNFIRFAPEKKVKRLEVDLSLYDGGVQPTRHTLNCVPFGNRLTSLLLGCVNITGEMLESFLWNCQALEYLSVHRSNTLLSLKVTGRSRNLKTLRISKSDNIKQFEISDPNLVSVYFCGPKMKVELKSTPKLVEVSLGGIYATDLDSSFSDLSGYHSQIEALSLYPIFTLRYVIISVKDPILFTRLKKLDMTVHPVWYNDLHCTSLENMEISVNGPIFTRFKKLDMTVAVDGDADHNCFALLLKP